MNIIEVNNLSFKHGDKIILNKLSFEIRKSSWTTILGNNGSGKSTLIKILLGILDNDGEIFIDNIRLNKKNISQIRPKIGVVFENVENTFIADLVEEELVFVLENLNYSRDYIKERLNEIIDDLKLKKIIDKKIIELTPSEKVLVAIAAVLIAKPKIIIIDETISHLDYENKIIVFDFLQKLKNQSEITIINISHDIEETIYGDDIIVIHNNKVFLKGTKEEVLKKEKAFNKLEMSLPLLASLSINLGYYNLLDDIILDRKKLVDTLWK